MLKCYLKFCLNLLVVFNVFDRFRMVQEPSYESKERDFFTESLTQIGKLHSSYNLFNPSGVLNQIKHNKQNEESTMLYQPSYNCRINCFTNCVNLNPSDSQSALYCLTSLCNCQNLGNFKPKVLEKEPNQSVNSTEKEKIIEGFINITITISSLSLILIFYLFYLRSKSEKQSEVYSTEMQRSVLGYIDEN